MSINLHPFTLFLLFFSFVTVTAEERQIELQKIVKVKTADSNQFEYDVYLPKQYSDQSKFLPVVFTSNPGGGGMTGAYRAMADKMGIILIGNKKYKNGTNLCYEKDVYTDVVWADIDKWLRYHPSKVIFAGFSGGGLNSFSNALHQQERVAAVFSVGGWMGRNWDEIRHRYSKGLIVARSNGVKDEAARCWIDPDKTHLDKFGVTLKDYDHPGGHCDAPTNIKVEAFNWILSQIEEIPNDFQKAQKLEEKCAKKIKSKPEVVIWSCLRVINETPRSWQSKVAVKTLETIFADYKKVRKLKLHSKLKNEIRVNDFLIHKVRMHGIANRENLFKSYLHFLLETDVINQQTWTERIAILSMVTCQKPFRDGNNLLKIFKKNCSNSPETVKSLMGQGLLFIKMKKWNDLKTINDKLANQKVEYEFTKKSVSQLIESHTAQDDKTNRSDWITSGI